MLRPGEKAVTVLGGAEVQGWPPGCGGACEPLPSCELLSRGGAGPPESARAALSCRLPRLRCSPAGTSRQCLQHERAAAQGGPRAGRAAGEQGSGGIGVGAVRAAAPPGDSRGARAEPSSGSLTLGRGRRRHQAWTAWRVLGCRAPAERVSGVTKRGPWGHSSGVRLEVVSPRRRKERAGGYPPACLSGLVGGGPL